MNENDLIELHDGAADAACIAAVLRDHLDKAAREGTLGIPDTPDGARAVDAFRHRLDMLEMANTLEVLTIRTRLGRRPPRARRHG